MGKLFGTNGIRGVTNEDMNGQLAFDIGKAWGTLLKRQEKLIHLEQKVNRYKEQNIRNERIVASNTPSSPKTKIKLVFGLFDKKNQTLYS